MSKPLDSPIHGEIEIKQGLDHVEDLKQPVNEGLHQVRDVGSA